MKKRNIKLTTILILLITTIFVLNFYFSKNKSNKINTIHMQLSSPAFAYGDDIPTKFTCDGENVNPPLVISEVPQEAKSLVLIVDDPDAPSGTWLHWSLWNIPMTTIEIKENSLPIGSITGTNDFNLTKYRGPCPPSGTHRYFFKLYALDNIINLPEGASLSELEEKMKNHILEEVELIGKYSKE